MSTKILKNAPLFHHIDTRGSGYFCVGFCSSQSNAFFTGHFPPCLNLNQSRGKEWGIEGWRKGALVKIQRAGELNVPRSSPYQVTGSSGGWWHPWANRHTSYIPYISRTSWSLPWRPVLVILFFSPRLLGFTGPLASYNQPVFKQGNWTQGSEKQN